MISKQLYIVKLSSYTCIKEQLKFASFLGVEGGPKQPSEVSNIYL